MSVPFVPSIGVNSGTAPRLARGQELAAAPEPAAPEREPAAPERVEPSPAQVLATLTPKNTRLSIERDEATDRFVFKSLDAETGEVIRQYPTKEMLTLIARVRQITGLTVDKGA